MLNIQIYHLTSPNRMLVHIVRIPQVLGFVHGVLNTDNMSIMGLTIDYGPFGFLEHFDPDYTPNGSDGSARSPTHHLITNPLIIHSLITHPLITHSLITHSLITPSSSHVLMTRRCQIFLREPAVRLSLEPAEARRGVGPAPPSGPGQGDLDAVRRGVRRNVHGVHARQVGTAREAVSGWQR